MNRKTSESAGESAVDRLIALASDEKPAAAKKSAEQQANGPTDPGAVPMLADPRELGELEHNPMWKALLQFRAVVPYLARMLEMSQPAGGGVPSTELKQSVTQLESSHRELRLAVQDQVVQMKRLQEELTRAREATERNSMESQEMAEDLRAMHSLVRRAAVSLGLMLAVLIGLIAWVAARVPHLLH